jgi:type II secretory pathway pseudopilin PulG
MLNSLRHPDRPRRGVTLVEMLVVVALVVLMMVVLVQVFQTALGAMSVSRTTQELDVVLRSIDSMIRSDLGGVTAKMTPPNNPALKQGYFEYIENAPADLQGEDGDDILAFTTRAPEGQSFSGRQWLSNKVNGKQMINQAIQPTTISSQTAEVIYFLRNGNLYRRVFLVAPNRANSLTVNGSGLPLGVYQTSMFGKPLLVSWQGMNDVSCRPGGFNGSAGSQPPIPNDLGDLTNRENRAFRPRFLNDFTGPNGVDDGIPDDSNADGVPDYYPTLYYDGVGHAYKDASNNPIWSPDKATHEAVGYRGVQRVQQSTANSYDVYAFPFIYPGMYSVPDPNRLNNGLGWVHYLPPNASTGYINHSPLDVGDTANFTPASNQTWWGFPTWRETMSGLGSGGGTGWRDPINFVASSSNYQQPLGLRPFAPPASPSLASATFLPPVTMTGTTATPFGSDGAGSKSFVANPTAPNHVWEDDLIMTHVRSFDVKAYDPNASLYNQTSGTFFSAGYHDLGYGSLNAATGNTNLAAGSTVYGPNGLGGTSGTNQVGVGFQGVNAEPTGFGHEGRIPPLPGDFRLHPRRGFNIGDPSAGVTRLTHTFDTWSTDYVNAPDSDIDLNGLSANSPPIYPSFPPPYPSPLRGIQIQVRVTDARNERTKVLTIRHDFTDKLAN